MLGRIEQFDIANGVSYSFACSNCCGNSYSNSYITPEQMSIFVGRDVLDSAIENDINCYGVTLEGYSISYADWLSSAANVATVSNGLVRGVSTGPATVIARWTVYQHPWNQYNRYCMTITINIEKHSQVEVILPTSLQVLSATALPDGLNPPCGCPGSANYGIKIDVKYQVLDQLGRPIPSSDMTPHETGTFFSGGNFDGDIGPKPGYPTSSKNTAADGTFHDVPLGMCRGGPINDDGSNVATQNITMVMPNGASFPVRSQSWKVTAPGTVSFGHGTIKNTINSPGTGSDVEVKR
jgi:hypothetical protein